MTYLKIDADGQSIPIPRETLSWSGDGRFTAAHFDHGDDWFILRLHRDSHSWAGKCETITGTYRRLEDSDYNTLDIPSVEVVQVDEQEAEDLLDGIAEDSPRVRKLRQVCEGCLNLIGWKTNRTCECVVNGDVSLVRGSCHEWERSTFDSMTYKDVTEKTPVDVISLIDESEFWNPKQCGFKNVQQFHRLWMGTELPKTGVSGRGIVMVGGGIYFPSAYVSIRMIRHVGCDLPIELWGLPGELGEKEQNILAQYGVKCIDVGGMNYRRMGGWELKSYAVMRSAFESVLYLDADSYPVADPTPLFDIETPAIFWPDNQGDDLDPLAWKLVGLDPIDEPAFESGQFIVHKSKCWKAMSVAVWMNQHSDYWYNVPGPKRKVLLYGDKDTFHMAFRKTNTEYRMPNRRPKWEGHTYQHYDLQGGMAFHHRCRDKFTLGTGKSGYGEFSNTEQLFNTNTYDSSLMFEDYCFHAVEDLRDLIDGVTQPPDEEVRKIAMSQMWHMIDVGSGLGRDVTMLASGRVMPGNRQWYVHNGRIWTAGQNVLTGYAMQDDGSFLGMGRGGRPSLLLPTVAVPDIL